MNKIFLKKLFLFPTLISCILIHLNLYSIEKITIIAENDWYHYSSDQVLNHPGYAYELTKLVFENINLKNKLYELDLQYDSYENCYLKALSGEVHGCFDTAQLKENESLFLFHKKPLFTDEIVIYQLKKNKNIKLKSFIDLEKSHLNIGYTKGYQYGDEFDMNNGIKKIPFAKDSAGLKELQECSQNKISKKNCSIDGFVMYKKVGDVIFNIFSDLEKKVFDASTSFRNVSFYISFTKEPKTNNVNMKQLIHNFDVSLDNIVNKKSNQETQNKYKSIYLKYFGENPH